MEVVRSFSFSPLLNSSSARSASRADFCASVYEAPEYSG